MPILTVATLKLDEKGWESFSSWLLSVSSFHSLDTPARVPASLAAATVDGFIYKTGGSLYDSRHTLLEAQRRFPGSGSQGAAAGAFTAADRGGGVADMVQAFCWGGDVGLFSLVGQDFNVAFH